MMRKAEDREREGGRPRALLSFADAKATPAIRWLEFRVWPTRWRPTGRRSPSQALDYGSLDV